MNNPNLEKLLKEGWKYQLTYGNYRGKSSYNVYSNGDDRIIYDPTNDRIIYNPTNDKIRYDPTNNKIIPSYVFKEKRVQLNNSENKK